MIDGAQIELKTLVNSKLSIMDADEILKSKYDLQTGEMLEQTVFEFQQKIENQEL